MGNYFERLLYKKKKSFYEKLLLSPLYFASLIYGLILRIRAYLYFKGIFKVAKLPCPVISIGNLTLGGTGKTTLLMTIAKRLKQRGICVAILTRGYRGKMSQGYILKNDEEEIKFSPELAGDEPFLMAKNLNGIPIFIGRDRLKNGLMAIKYFSPSCFLIDDGFQYLKLYRDVNILLIDSLMEFGDGHIFPSGILREPLSQLKRADIFLITKVINPESLWKLKETILKIKPYSKIFYSHYEPICLIGPNGEIRGVRSFIGKNVIGLSGIGNPGYFSYLLRKCGMNLKYEIIFPDHHFYTMKDLTIIEEKIKEVDCIVTTEKDMVKLIKLNLNKFPIYALRIEIKIWEEEEFFKIIFGMF